MTVVWPVFLVSLSISQLYKRVCRRTRRTRLLGRRAWGTSSQLCRVRWAGVWHARGSALQRNVRCKLHGARWKSVVCHVEGGSTRG